MIANYANNHYKAARTVNKYLVIFNVSNVNPHISWKQVITNVKAVLMKYLGVLIALIVQPVKNVPQDIF